METEGRILSIIGPVYLGTPLIAVESIPEGGVEEGMDVEIIRIDSKAPMVMICLPAEMETFPVVKVR